MAIPNENPIAPDNLDQTSNSAEGDYSDQSWSISEATAFDEDELARFESDHLGDDGGTTESDDFFSDLEGELAAFLDGTDTDPTLPHGARGTPLWIGFDAEWVWDEATETNTILSIQLYVPQQEALSQDLAKQNKIKQLSRIVYASEPTREGRPALLNSLRQLIDQALEGHLIEEEPAFINVVGFGLRFDLAALSDFSQLKNQIDSVSGKVATVSRNATMEFPKTLVTGDGFSTLLIGLKFIDVAAHVPPGTALRHIGQLLNLPKLEIPAPYSIEHMDEYLKRDPEGYEAYAMRDAEIAVVYARRLAEFAKKELGIKSLPATASGLALKWLLKTLKETGIDPLAAFGLHKTRNEFWHSASKQARFNNVIVPTPMRRIQEAFLTDCYAGGRNEAFILGPTPVGHWLDLDLAGAYSSGLVDLPLIDFENPRSSLNIEDYLGHVAGYALIDFEHPADTRYPVFAISRGGRGLIFPLQGQAYATAPEIQVARDLGCQITIKWGVVYPWKRLPGDDAEGDPALRLFGPFVKAARQLRAKLKKQAAGKDSLEEQAAKLYANSVYGKLAQSLRDKNVFDTRSSQTIKLKPSAITNPAIAAHVTGFIRAILAEVLNRIPRHRMVVSVTTDGFLTDATEDEIDLSGPLCKRFQALCDEILPGSQMLEVKHEVAQVVCMKTRGQLTGQALPGKKIVLAKAGVQPLVKADPNLSAEEYKHRQNDAMLDLYLDRYAGQTMLVSQFASLHDQWEKGVDLHKFERNVVMSLEPDMKRQLINPHMIEIASKQRYHLAMDSQPWRTVEDFDAARTRLDGWRRSHCLRTVEDWKIFSDSLMVGMVRSKQRAAGVTAMNQRGGRDASDVLRRAFLRAYAQEKLGLTRSLTYPVLADWLTQAGYATKASEPRSARAQPLVLHSTPRTDDVMKLWQLLQDKFPEADLTLLLATE